MGTTPENQGWHGDGEERGKRGVNLVCVLVESQHFSTSMKKGSQGETIGDVGYLDKKQGVWRA